MGCCGRLFRKRHGDASQSEVSSPTQLHRRLSVVSTQSQGSVYFDAPEDLEGRASGATSEAGSISPPVGMSGQESRQDENKGPISALFEAFTRRASLKSKPSTERRTSEAGLTDEERDSPGCLPGASSANRERSRAEASGPSLRPFAGASFKKGEQVGSTDGVECWQMADGTSFQVRGPDYDSTRKKVNSRGAVYRLIGVDAYSFEQKIYHIAQHVQLPDPPELGPDFSRLPPDRQLPPLLVMNIQLPTYKPGLLNRSVDGKGVSLVYYFALPDGFELSHVENKAALELLQRFVHDGTEENGDKTRERLKLIARVVNVEQWAKEGPLSNYEHSLLRNYNDKPILTRPQQAFFQGSHYLEIDLDIHSYAWVARQAFERFIPRLGPVVFENAFVVQGNRPEELPEVIMACARVSRIDLYKVQPFPASLRKTKSHKTTVELDPDAPPLVSNTFPDDFSGRSKATVAEAWGENGEADDQPETGKSS